MVTPTDKELRMSIWDEIRFRLRIRPVASHEKLVQSIRAKLGLKKFERATAEKHGRSKSLLALVRKSDFWKKSKYEDMLEWTQSPKQWKEGEESILRGLMKQGLKGKELVSEFNMRVGPVKRTYMGVMVRKTKLKE